MESGSLAKVWKNLQAVQKGQRIAAYDNGEEFYAEEDGYIVFPSVDEKIEEGWWYFGVKSDFPSP